MANIFKFGAVAVAATAILSNSAAAQGLLFVGVEGALLQSQVELDPPYSYRSDDPKDTSMELGLKAGYDFDTFRIWGGYSYRSKGSQKYSSILTDSGSGGYTNYYTNRDGKFNWQTNNILVGANYTPSLNDKFKLSLGGYAGFSYIKEEISTNTTYITITNTPITTPDINGLTTTYTSTTYTFSDTSDNSIGMIIGLKAGGIYEVDKNNEIELGIKWDYQTAGVDHYDNIVNYGLYVGYNYKF